MAWKTQRNSKSNKGAIFVKEVLNFGILGCGLVANIHAEALSHIQEAKLIGVADYIPSLAQTFAQQQGVKAYADYAEMLADPELDVVCVCTPSCFHAPNAKEALQKGKHVVLEKPMALTEKEADELIAVCDSTDRYLTVISQLRFSEDVVKVKELIQQNAFGKISLCDLYMKYWRSEEYYSSSPWKGTKKFDGGGALMNQGIHGIDLLEYIMGPIKDLQGKIKTLSHAIEVEDTAVALLEFENGALGVIEASTCAYPGFDRRIQIHGDKGYVILEENRIVKIMINDVKTKIKVEESVSTANDPTTMPSFLHELQIKNFIHAIQGKERLCIDQYEGKKAIRIIDGIYKNAQS